MTQEKDLKIIFWGTPEFALPVFGALIKNGYNVVAAVTNPDEPVGRKQILTPPAVKALAQKHKIPVFQPVKFDQELFKKEIPEADLYIVAAFGKIIPKEILEIPKWGALNIHPSLLPRWRGPSPIQYTILHGDKEAGVTIMKMDERMDHGPIVAQRRLEIRKWTFRELHDDLAKLGAELLIETLPGWLASEIRPEPQDDAKATYSKILKKDDGRINWSRPAEEIERAVRALNPWPGTWTIWPTETKIIRLRIEEANWIEDEPPVGSPGYVWQNSKFPLLIKTGRGSLSVNTLTLESKKALVSDDFIRGYPRIIGTTLV